MFLHYYKRLTTALRNYSLLVQNFSWLSLVEIVTMLTPLITYPYVVRVLGSELYGLIITAQVLVSYAQLIIEFGSNSVCAKHVSINRDNPQKLSEIVCSIYLIRATLWVICFAIYMLIVFLIPLYREWSLLFFLTFFMAINEVLYPRYFFQGIENMRFISLVSIFTKLFFVCLMFFFVKNVDDYLFVPILYSVGFSLGGIVSIWVIFKRLHLKFVIPKWREMKVYLVDSLPIFSTDLICTIKDKLNYQLLGFYVGMTDVVIYDLGFKLNSLVSKPTTILTTVLFPKFARSRDIRKLKIAILISFISCLFVCVFLNLFLPWIVEFFLHRNDVDLLPIRIISLFPVFLSVSIMISQNYFVAFGHNKYVLYSILITTLSYVIFLIGMLLTHRLNSIYSFVFLALIGYITELSYRLYVLLSKEHKNGF